VSEFLGVSYFVSHPSPYSNKAPTIVEMTNREYRRFESYKQAEKIVRSIKRSLKDVALSNTGTKKLKSARELINEI